MSDPTHSRFSPSAASRWAVCTASIPFIEANAHRLPKDTSSAYADEGTEAHAQAAAILLGQQRLVQSDNADMIIHVRAYVDFVREKVQAGDRLLVEKRVPLFFHPQQKGTADAVIVKPRSIYIADLKYGVGVSVRAKDNKQLAIYAESVIRELETIDEVPDDTLVTLAIFQPRDRSDPEPVRLWAVSRAELRDFVAPVAEAKWIVETSEVDAEGSVLKGEARFVADPDGPCRFCPAKGICRTYASYGLAEIPEAEVAVHAGNGDGLPPVGSVTREQRQRILAAKKALLSWLEAVEEQEVHELLQGATPLQFKLVTGKANRQWADEAAAEKLLRNHLPAEQVRPPGSILSVAQAEKQLKGIELSTKFQNRFAALVTKPEGKPTLVPVTDARPALEIRTTSGLTAIADPADVI